MLNLNGKLLVILVVMLAVCWAAAAEEPVLNTKAAALENLAWAHRCEMSGRLRYAAFARKAEQEGHMTAAIRFWMMSDGEALHARAAAREIKRLGGKIEKEVCLPTVRSTKENLDSAAITESTEAKEHWNKSLRAAQQAAHDTTDYDKFDLKAQCPAEVNASPEVRLFLMLKTVDNSYAENCVEQLTKLEDDNKTTQCSLAPEGLKIRKQGLKLLKKHGLT